MPRVNNRPPPIDSPTRTGSGAGSQTELPLKPWQKALTVLREDLSGVHPRLIALNLASRFLPRHSGQQSRARLFGLAGFSVGEGTRLLSTPTVNGGPGLFSNLIIGRDCFIDVDCVFDLGERVSIGNRVTLGPGVMLLTSTHELDFREHRAGAVQLRPVAIGDGAWLGAHVTVLPGVTIGEGAVVDAGSVVNKEVPPDTRVGGIPAVRIESLAAEHQTKSPST
jgi:maltose O-acetyltransferase